MKFFYHIASLLLLIFAGCNTGEVKINSPFVTIADTVIINRCENLYNTYYSKFNETKALNCLDTAGIYADSLLAMRHGMLADSALRKKYLAILSYRANDFIFIQQFGKALEMADLFFHTYDSLHLEKDRFYYFVKGFSGNVYTRFGDYKKALEYLSGPYAYYTAQNDDDKKVSCAINMCIVFNEIKQYDSIIPILLPLTALTEIKNRHKANIQAMLASAYLSQGDTTLAEKHVHTAAAIAAKYITEPSMSEPLSSVCDLYASLEAGKKNYAAAKGFYRQSLSFTLKENKVFRRRETGKILNNIGNICEAAGEIDSAISYYHKALYTVTDVDPDNIYSLPSSENVYAENTIMESLDNIAGCMSAHATPNEINWLTHAVSCYNISMQTERKLMLAFTYDESKYRMLQDSRKRSEYAINICYKLYEQTHTNEWAVAAYQFAEKNKAFVLLESVKRNLAASYLQNDTLYLQMQQQQSAYALAEKAVAEAQIQKDSALIIYRNRQLKAFGEALQKAKAAFEYNNSAYRQLMEKDDDTAVAKTAALITDQHTALIEYFYGDSSCYGFQFLYGNSITMFKQVSTIENDIDSFLLFFKNKNAITESPVAFNAAAYKLYQSLQLQFISKETSSLIIIPDGPISFIPFDALISTPSAGIEPGTYHYIVKEKELHYGFSVATLAAQLTQNNTTGHTIIFAPGFLNKERDLAPLKYSQEETESIKINSENTFNGNRATLHAFKAAAPSAGLIHVASHAATGSLPKVEFIDSSLYLNEIYAMQLKAHLVVISACESGIGKVDKSEGTLSLARGFYYAGAQNIITSLWNADDKSTAELFKKFYDAGNTDYAAALTGVKRKYLQENIRGVRASPYYWAGFIIAGNGISPNHSHFLLYAIAAIAAITMLIIFMRKKQFN